MEKRTHLVKRNIRKRRGPQGRRLSVHDAKPKHVYDFIIAYKTAHDGNSPTFRQIGDACGITSTSVVNFYLVFLEEQGLVKVERSWQTRSISIVGASWRPPEHVGHSYRITDVMLQAEPLSTSV